MFSKKLWLYLLAALIAGTVLLVALLPWLARIALVDVLQQNLHGLASIEEVRIDLRRGVVTINSLEASDDAELKLRSGSLQADLGLRALFSGDINGKIELRDALVDYGDLVVKLERLSFDGALVPADTGDAPEWLVQGNLAIDALGLFDRAQQLTLLSLGKARVSETVFNTANMALDIPSLKLTQIGVMKADVEDARWLYGEEIEITGLQYGEDLLKIDVHATRLEYGDLVTRFERLSFDGALKQVGSGDAPQLLVQGDLSIDALGLFDRAREITLLSLGEARLSDAAFNTDTLALGISGLRLAQIGAVNTGSEDSHWLYGEHIALESLRYADNRLEVASIESSAVSSVAQITAEGELESQGVLIASLEALVGETGEPEAQEPGPEFEWAVGEVRATDSELRFTDQRLPLTLNLAVEQLSLSSLDSLKPEQVSTIALKSGVGDYSRIDFSGEFSPLSEQASLDVKGRIDALSLPLVSAYIEPLLGYELSAGQFDHDFDIQIKEETLTASNSIDLRGLKVTKLSDVTPTAPVGIPLDTGLNMLRDKQGNIHLDVPLKGRLDDPEIGLNQVISKALTKALTSSSTTMLKLALQPYGAIWMGAEMGLKMATQVRLDPMLFPPLSGELDGEGEDYAGKLGVLLTERPAMHLTLCGVSGAGDQAALAQMNPTEAEKTDLTDLAKARSDALKSFLVNKKQVDPSRLLVCKPSVDPEGKVSGIKLEL